VRNLISGIVGLFLGVVFAVGMLITGGFKDKDVLNIILWVLAGMFFLAGLGYTAFGIFQVLSPSEEDEEYTPPRRKRRVRDEEDEEEEVEEVKPARRKQRPRAEEEDDEEEEPRPRKRRVRQEDDDD
jgi:hypothetical protein